MSGKKTRPVVPWTSSEIPTVLTYVYPRPDAWEPTWQLRWDYQIEWPRSGRPKITMLRFCSYQQKTAGGKAELVEEITEDIPVNEALMMEISKHASGYLYADSDIEGDWSFADRTFFKGCAEAAKKTFSLAAFRQMAQGDPNPRL
jgi:hypothetical protein